MDYMLGEKIVFKEVLLDAVFFGAYLGFMTL